MAYDPTIVLPFGTKVRLIDIDEYGLWGRERHPTKDDLGFTGVVTSNVVENDGDVDVDVEPGTAIPEDAFIVYAVLAPNGKTLDLAGYEVEVAS